MEVDLAKKKKILKKYLEDNNKNIKKQSINNYGNMQIVDHQQIIDSQHSSKSEQQSSNQIPKKRIDSSQDDQPKQQKQRKKESKLNKKLRKALGVKNSKDMGEFLKEIKIEGMDDQQLKNYITKNKNVKIEFENKQKVKKSRKQKKKVKRQHQSDDQRLKRQMFENSSSSDLEIPQQARTIYRNKDGTIKLQSDKQMKQKHNQQIMERLGQWEKGMKKQQKQESDEDVARAKQTVFDDPMRRWQINNYKNPLQCQYQGPTNRFNIKPGYRWDGVIRGNGFQNKYLQQQNLKKIKTMREDKEYLKNI